MATFIGARSPILAHKLCQTVSRCVIAPVTWQSSSSTVARTTINKLHQSLLTTSKRLLHGNTLSNQARKDFKVLQNLLRRTNTHGRQIVVPLFKCEGRVICARYNSGFGGKEPIDHTSVVLYFVSVLILMVGVAYAGVPLYKMFCQQFGLGGSAEYSRNHDSSKVEHMQKIEDREIVVTFSADTASTLNWDFKPQQHKITVVPGETALAFYTAKNPTDKPVIGISTYTVLPYAAAPYFNKIQCFCFEEQILNPHEQVDMPVFFFIDPEIDDDPALEQVNNVFLSYTFFEAKEGLELPLPGFITGRKTSVNAT